MALIKCYECSKEISDKANSCPHCGAPKIDSKSTSQKINDEKCKKCDEILVSLVIGSHVKEDYKGEMKICVSCRKEESKCPVCSLWLRTSKSQQCQNCFSSWHQKKEKKSLLTSSSETVVVDKELEKVKKAFEVSGDIKKKSGNIFWIVIVIFVVAFGYSQIKTSNNNSSSNDKINADDETTDQITNERILKKPKDVKWYEDGDLHKSYVFEWREASYSNKLATCGDWMAVVDNEMTMDKLRSRAEQLVICIDETVAKDASGEEISGTMTTADIAVLCVQLLFQ